MAKVMAKAKKIKVTLVKSTIGALKNQKATIEALGLKKIGSTNEFDNSEILKGMLAKVAHLVKVEEI